LSKKWENPVLYEKMRNVKSDGAKRGREREVGNPKKG
jgi:hypothetical protein